LELENKTRENGWTQVFVNVGVEFGVDDEYGRGAIWY